MRQCHHPTTELTADMSEHCAYKQHTTACVRSLQTTADNADSRHVCMRPLPQLKSVVTIVPKEAKSGAVS